MMPNLAPECPDPCRCPMQLLLAALPPQPQLHLPQVSRGGRAWPCSSTAASLRLHLLPPRHHRDIGHSALAKRRLRGALRLFSSGIALHPGCGLFGPRKTLAHGLCGKRPCLGVFTSFIPFPQPLPLLCSSSTPTSHPIPSGTRWPLPLTIALAPELGILLGEGIIAVSLAAPSGPEPTG